MARKIGAPIAIKAKKDKESPPEFVASTATVLVVGLFIIAFCMQAFAIPTGSMEQTLLIGDHLFVDRATMGPKTSWMPLIPYRSVQRRDIVVFLSPAEPGKYLVKRIVGIAGDRIHLRDNVLYVNGVAQEEPYVVHNGSHNGYRDNFPNVSDADDPNINVEWQLRFRHFIDGGDIVVPPDHYFGMGDNRDVSLDSRYWGFIPKENVIGRPMFIYWSFVTPDDEHLKNGMRDRVSFMAHVVVHFFDETRWQRMLRPAR